MIEQVEKVKKEIENFATTSSEELEQFRIKYLGSKGEIKQLFSAFKDVPNDQKKAFGQELNALKNLAQDKFDSLKNATHSQANLANKPSDLTRPGIRTKVGTRHPISMVRHEICEIFGRIGYTVEEGPEVEDDWHNFTALNFPEEHPARDMQDTFFVKNDEEELALRTHTSSVQVRIMENNTPPIRIVAPGRVYRNEAISARAHCFFHQVEGLYIDTDVSFADLKQTLQYFVKEMFGENAAIRLRPSYFPFTEPSAEMDVSCTLCNGDGCNVCKYTGWLEIMGCGMVDPNVLENCGIDSSKYSGFAFGMGVERIAQLKYQVNDLRLYSENDTRFLDQFKSLH